MLRSVLTVAGLLTACASVRGESDHFDGKKFYNPSGPVEKSFFDLIKWKWQGGQTPWPEKVENSVKPDLPKEIASGKVAVTWIGHATHLIQFGDVNILMDPIYSERASPLSFAGPKRVREPGVPFDQLPKIHAVVVTHNHYDHMDLPTLKRLFDRDKPVFIVPLANAETLESAGIKGIQELDWWQNIKVGTKSVITLVPAQHWSARGLFDRHRALWGGYVIESEGLKLYLSGDTGYGPHFKQIKERCAPIHVAILPIGAYEPRWFMKEQHINPEEAVQAQMDLEIPTALASHYATFQLTDEGIGVPAKDLKAALIKYGRSETSFLMPEPGSTLVLSFEGNSPKFHQ